MIHLFSFPINTKQFRMKHIPNLISCLNLASGFLAVIFSATGDLNSACWLILAAMVFDFLDGFSARQLKAYSLLGKELDSLADIVSFGVAPALILFRQIEAGFVTDPASGHSVFGRIIQFIPLMMPVFAGLRLAKFNTDPAQSTSFKGLPTPANALAVISVVIASDFSEIPFIKSFVEIPVALALYCLILSVLMVTRIRLLSLKITSVRLKGNEGRYILLLLSLGAFVILGIGAAPLIIPIYIAASLASSFFPETSLSE
jgi:CDP-diacylglycerol--serine O-phosphatidyltransferase